MIIYLNGNFMEEEKAVVSVFDHGFLYGDGIFEGIMVYDGRIFALDEHIKRFYDSARSILLELPLDQEEMKQAIIETVRKNNLRDAYVRPIASRGKGALGLDPGSCKEATVVIIVDSETRHPEDHGEASFETKGIKVISSSCRRNGPDVLSPRIKSTNYLNNILAKIQANSVGAQDAVMLNSQGQICEMTADNIFTVRDNCLITPPVESGLLDGITRRTIMKIALNQGLKVSEEILTLHDIYTCDECFCTATRIEILPIVWVDGRIINTGLPGPVTTRLAGGFRELITKEGTPVY
ncbi:MAG: branched-chain-amino-acid transaminase [Planctomycetota bacterium]|jgi:branched-chain amino acid aminotransferase